MGLFVSAPVFVVAMVVMAMSSVPMGTFFRFFVRIAPVTPVPVPVVPVFVVAMVVVAVVVVMVVSAGHACDSEGGCYTRADCMHRNVFFHFL